MASLQNVVWCEFWECWTLWMLCYSRHTCTAFLHCEPTEQNRTLLLWTYRTELCYYEPTEQNFVTVNTLVRPFSTVTYRTKQNYACMCTTCLYCQPRERNGTGFFLQQTEHTFVKVYTIIVFILCKHTEQNITFTVHMADIVLLNYTQGNFVLAHISTAILHFHGGYTEIIMLQHTERYY